MNNQGSTARSPVHSVDEEYIEPQCIVCNIPASKQKLKRCTGCGIMEYCSRECQRAGWPAHRAFCTANPLFVIQCSALGYTTPSALLFALQWWIKIHQWSITTLVSIFAHQDPRFEHYRSSSRPMPAALFIIDADNHVDDRSPAQGFRIAGGPTWMHCRDTEEENTIAGQDRDNSGRFKLKTVFRIRDREFCVNEYIPVFRVRMDRLHRQLTEEACQAALALIEELCCMLANLGIVYEKPETVEVRDSEPALRVFDRSQTTLRWKLKPIDRAYREELEALCGVQTLREIRLT